MRTEGRKYKHKHIQRNNKHIHTYTRTKSEKSKRTAKQTSNTAGRDIYMHPGGRATLHTCANRDIHTHIASQANIKSRAGTAKHTHRQTGKIQAHQQKNCIHTIRAERMTGIPAYMHV